MGHLPLSHNLDRGMVLQADALFVLSSEGQDGQ